METVQIDFVFPLTGNSAASGGEGKASIEVAADIINTALSLAGNITARGVKCTFRVTPIASNFADSYMRFL